MAATTEVMDEQLAPSDFLNRLIVVNIADVSSAHDSTGTKEIWWPALKFDSLTDLMDMDGVVSTHFNALRAQIVLSTKKMKTTIGIKASDACGLAYLLGRRDVNRSLILLPEHGKERIMGDFFRNYEKILAGDGLYGEDEFRSVLKLIEKRMEAAIGTSLKDENGDTTLSAAHIRSDNVETTSSRTRRNMDESGKPKLKYSSRKTVCHAEHSEYVIAYALPKSVSGTVVVAKRPSQETEKNILAPTEKHPEKDKDNPADEFSFEVNNTDESVVSPLQSPSSTERKSRCKPPANKNMPWCEMWNYMRSEGWGWKTGTGVVSYYYVHPEHIHLNKSDLIKHCIDGEHYFSSEEAVKRYARKNLRWKGGVESPQSSDSADHMTERVKKHNRSKVAKRGGKMGYSIESVKEKSCGVLSKNGTLNKMDPSQRSDDSSESGGEGFSRGQLSQEGPLSSIESPSVGKLDFHKSTAKMTGHKRENPASRSSSTTADSTAPSSSSSTETSVDPTYKIMTHKDALECLTTHFGFSHYRGMYCFPGDENRPGKNSIATENKNYFSSLDRLRKNLCAFGLPAPKRGLSDDQLNDIERWVRYAHVENIADGACINEICIGLPITQNYAWKLLQKYFGMKFSSGYVIPGSDSSRSKRFDRAEDFFLHLSRFGIPHVDGAKPDLLDRDDRLMLDLFISDPEGLNTFQRINPETNSITPRRTRTESRALGSSNNYPTDREMKGNSVRSEKNSQQSNYSKAFEQLKAQRSLPTKLISSADAFALLQKHYNFINYTDDNHSVYSFPDINYTFNNIQEMRENLCKYGLPNIARGSDISEKDLVDLEFWIRCAHIKGLRDEQSTLPDVNNLNQRKVKSILKGLGYQMSKDHGLYTLCDADFQKPRFGIDAWDNLLDFFNHIARFGLQHFGENAKCPVSEHEILSFSSRCLSDVNNRNRMIYESPAKTGEEENKRPNETFADESIAEDFDTFYQPPVVIDEHDNTPTNSPRKKRRVEQNTMLGYLVKKPVATLESVINRSRHDKSMSPTFEDETKELGKESMSPDLSASCLEKTDSDVEACFADSLDDTKISFDTNYHTPPMARPASKYDRVGVSPKLGEDTNVFATDPNSEAKSSKRILTLNVAKDLTPLMALKEAGTSSPMEPSTIYGETVKCTEPKTLSVTSDPTIDWKDMLEHMFADGLERISGACFESHWYVHPVHAGMNKEELESKCKEGEDYFATEDSLKRFAMKTLGWDGMFVSEKGIAECSSPNEGWKSSTPKKRMAEHYVSDEVNVPEKQKRRKDSIIRAPSTDPELCLPDRELNSKHKLECCLMVLDQRFKGNYHLPASPLTDTITDFMTRKIETSIDPKGLTPSPGFLYICGRPGTGKTTLVSACAEKAKVMAEKRSYDKPCISLINAAVLSSSSTVKDGIKKALLAKLAKQMGFENDPSINGLKKQVTKKVLILVLDEVEMILKKRDSDGEDFFRELIDLANSRYLRFSIIGISNCVSDMYSERIKEIGHPQDLVFPTYNRDSLLSILQRRIGKKIVDPKALELLSRKVESISGDARRVLEITCNAVHRCIATMPNEDLEKKADDEDMPLVKLPHMMWAILEANAVKNADLIRGLPPLAKIVLCIAASIAHVWGPNHVITLSLLKKFCVEATRQALFEDGDIGSIMSLVGMLCDAGLLVVANGKNFNPNDPCTRLKIDVHLDDLECALNESLVNGANGHFYSKLMDFIKTKPPPLS